MRTSTPPSPRRAHVLGLLNVAPLLVLVTGCATQQRKVEAFWPPPPETARIEYLRSFQNRDQLDPGMARRILNALVPHSAGAEIVSPSALALSPDHSRLYVACGGRGRVVVADLESRTMKMIVGEGPNRPVASVGVTVDADENIYVGDRMSNAVRVYDREGKYLRKIGEGKLEGPTMVAVDQRGRILYVVSGATSGRGDHRIEVFSLAGEHLRTLGARGDGPGEFNFPTALTVAPNGSLWVSDMLNFRVQVFDREGQLLSMYGQAGTGMVGAFDKIKGIAFDTFGNIYVVDTPQGVHIFNPEWRPLMAFGTPPFMNVPGPIVIDKRNHIFVADFGLNRVHEFRLVNTTAEDSKIPEGKPAESADGTAPAATAPSRAP